MDEYETIRLIDYLGLTQEQCAEQMEVARATVQAVYSSARTKLSRFLVEGTRLKIDGGHYELHDSSLECAQGHQRIRKGEIIMFDSIGEKIKLNAEITNIFGIDMHDYINENKN